MGKAGKSRSTRHPESLQTAPNVGPNDNYKGRDICAKSESAIGESHSPGEVQAQLPPDPFVTQQEGKSNRRSNLGKCFLYPAVIQGTFLAAWVYLKPSQMPAVFVPGNHSILLLRLPKAFALWRRRAMIQMEPRSQISSNLHVSLQFSFTKILSVKEILGCTPVSPT